MTKAVNIAEAKAQLSALLDRAAAGEEIVLSRAGRMPRQPGVRRSWQIPDELFLEPADAEDLRAAEGADTDALGLSSRR